MGTKAEAERQIRMVLEEALPLYYYRKEGGDVGEVLSVYLSVLDMNIHNYCYRPLPPQKLALDLYLHGYSLAEIVAKGKLSDYKPTWKEVYLWIFGDGREGIIGLTPAMYGIFIGEVTKYCPFCHDKQRGGNGMYVPKVNGSVCPHELIWYDEHMKELIYTRKAKRRGEPNESR